MRLGSHFSNYGSCPHAIPIAASIRFCHVWGGSCALRLFLTLLNIKRNHGGQLDVVIPSNTDTFFPAGLRRNAVIWSAHIVPVCYLCGEKPNHGNMFRTFLSLQSYQHLPGSKLH